MPPSLLPFAMIQEPTTFLILPLIAVERIWCGLPISIRKRFFDKTGDFALSCTNMRTDFFHELSRRKKVDSGGRAFNNVGYEVPGTAGKAKMEFISRYRFHIAFENRMTPGWTTEKFTDAFEAYAVPIWTNMRCSGLTQKPM